MEKINVTSTPSTVTKKKIEKKGGLLETLTVSLRKVTQEITGCDRKSKSLRVILRHVLLSVSRLAPEIFLLVLKWERQGRVQGGAGGLIRGSPQQTYRLMSSDLWKMETHTDSVEDGPALSTCNVAYISEGLEMSKIIINRKRKCEPVRRKKKRKESSHNGIQYREPWYVKKSFKKNVFLYFIFLNNIFKIKPFFSWRNKTYRKSSSPVSLCIRASTRIRWLKQNERLSF